MKREIKFRAWISNTGEMHSHQWLIGRMINGFCKHKWGDIFKEDGIIIMQYTGINDKNGKEIYEGDIVKSKYAGNDQVSTNIVVWSKQEVAFSFENLPMWAFEEFEIIGNIYEHPQLLK